MTLLSKLLRIGNRMARDLTFERKAGPDGRVYVLWEDESGNGLKKKLEALK